MPSRAEIRGGIETVLRAISIAVLALMLWLSLDRGRAETAVTSGSGNLATALRDWSTSGLAPDRIVARLDSVPPAVERDWLRALGSSGSELSWSGNLDPVSVSAFAAPTPRGGWNVVASAPSAQSIELSDDIGPIDTLKSSHGGARYFVPSASGVFTATSGSSTARAALDDSVTLRRVLVIGEAGWETKFVVAALEENGWKVDADMRVAPSVNVRQGSPAAMDTSRYSAVIALDAAAAPRASEIGRYAASGGGVIISGAATALDAFASLRVGTPGRRVTPSVVESEPGSIDLAALEILPIASLRADGIALERERGAITSAARRYGAGKVLQDGHLETWRWRMSGGDSGPGAHRDWWTQAVASVAYAPHQRIQGMPATDNAPFARLIAALGPASTASSARMANAAGPISLWLLFAILSLSLLGEWASRRLRGSR